MAGKNTAARKPVLNDMSESDTAAFDAMRDDAPVADAAPVADSPAEPVAQPDAAPAERGAPEAAPAAAVPEPVAQPEKTVPLSALHEERERRKASDDRARVLEERTNLLLQRIGQPAPAAPAAPIAPVAPKAIEIPDVEKDALGALRAVVEGFKTLHETDAQRQQRETADAAQRKQHEERVTAERGLIQHAAQAEREFVRETPDYDSASSYLKEMRYAALMAIPGMDQGQAIGIMQNEGIQLAARAVQNGMNPAAVIYNIAKAHGYRKTEAPPALVAPAPGTPTPEQRIETARRGQEHARSLGSTSGAAPAPQLTAAKLATMSEKDFAKFLDQATPAQMAEVFGS